MDLSNLKVGILQNRSYQGGGVQTYTKYLSVVLGNIPGVSVDLIVPEGYTPDKLKVNKVVIIGENENNSEILNKYDVIFASTIYDYIYKVKWLKWMSTYNGPIVSTIHSWSDFHPERKGFLEKTTLNLRNNKYIIDYDNEWCKGLIERYMLDDSYIRLKNYIGYPFVKSVSNKPKTKEICCFGRIYRLSILRSCRLVCNVLGFDCIDAFGKLYSDKDLPNYPMVNIVKETYSPEEVISLIEPYKYALWPDVRRNPDTDGSLEWVILEMLASNTVPVVYHTTANLYESVSNIYVRSFNRKGVVDSHSYEEIITHNKSRFTELSDLSKATEVMKHNLEVISNTWKK